MALVQMFAVQKPTYCTRTLQNIYIYKYINICDNQIDDNTLYYSSGISKFSSDHVMVTELEAKTLFLTNFSKNKIESVLCNISLNHLYGAYLGGKLHHTPSYCNLQFSSGSAESVSISSHVQLVCSCALK